jgi:chromosome segregation ATPase
MDYKEMNQILADLDQAMVTLEETYIENDGEVTEETEQLEAQISGLQELLTGEGIDLLGGWLKAKEDKKKSLKAEKDYITRQMAAIDETIDFIKGKISQVLKATGQEKVKGDRGYSFTATISSKTEVDKDVLKAIYADKVEEAIRAAHVPAYVGVTLTASSTKAADLGVVEGDEEIFVTTEKPSVRFTKPRATKEA